MCTYIASSQYVSVTDDDDDRPYFLNMAMSVNPMAYVFLEASQIHIKRWRQILYLFCGQYHMIDMMLHNFGG